MDVLIKLYLKELNDKNNIQINIPDEYETTRAIKVGKTIEEQ